MRILLSIIAGLFFSVFLVITVSLIISFVYEDEVTELFIEELNQRLEEDLRVGEVNLSLLKKFPNAVVEAGSFALYTTSGKGGQQKGSLSFTAEKVYFQFDVIDLFTGNYSLDHLYIHRAQINYTAGRDRFLLDYKQKPSEKLSINLNKIIFRDLYYTILNNDQSFSLEGHAPEMVLNGNISSGKFDLNIESENYIDILQIENFPYIQRKQVDFALNLLVDSGKYTVNSGFIRYGTIPLETEGYYNRNTQHLDLRLQGNNLNVRDFELYLPWKLKKQLEPLEIEKGRLNLVAHLRGPVKDGKPEFYADFALRQGALMLKHNNAYRFDRISFSGYISNGRYRTPASSMVTLTDLHAEFDENVLNCNLEISNFQQPHLNSEGNLNIQLGNISEHLKHPLLDSSTGNIYMNYELNNPLNEMDHFSQLIQTGRFSCDAVLDHVLMKSGKYQLAVENGFLDLAKDLYLDSISLYLNGNPMQVDGKIQDIYKNFADTSHVYQVNLNVKSPGINMNQLILGRDDAEDSLLHFRFPVDIAGTVHLETGRFQWNDFHANHVEGNIAFDAHHLKMDQFSFRAFGGKAYAQSVLTENKLNDDPFFFDSMLYLEHINIKEVFETFKHFGQDYITANNIGGKLYGEIKLEANMDSSLKINKVSLNTVSDIHIDDGQLTDVELFKEISKFINLSALHQVSFSRLSNKITISDQTIRIPKMDIQSSAFDMTLMGYHTFSNNFSYRVSMLLSQLLSRKARQGNDLRSEFGNVQEDGVGRTKLFFKIEGTPDQYAIAYDKEGVKERIRAGFDREKQELKQLFNEEFGLFKRDTVSPAGKQKQPANNRFGIEWESESESSQGQEAQQPHSRNEKDDPFVIEWESDSIN